MADLIKIGTRMINLDLVTHGVVGYATVISGGVKKKKVKEVKVFFGKDTITFTDVEADQLIKILGERAAN